MRQKGNLKRHMSTVHSAKNLQCEKCDFRTSSKTNLVKHAKTHINRQEKEQCNICGKEYSKGNLSKHIQVLHKEQKFQCKMCTYKTGVEKDLKNHILTHEMDDVRLKVKKFECSQCNSKFTKKYNLKSHIIKIHFENDIESIECNICGYKASNIWNLKKHTHNKHMSDNGKPMFECDVCKFKTKHKSSFERHLKVCNTEKSVFSCVICDSKLSTTDGLKSHIKTVHETFNEVQCKLCSFKTKTDRLLVLHEKNVHSDKPEDAFENCDKCGIKGDTTNCRICLK